MRHVRTKENRSHMGGCDEYGNEPASTRDAGPHHSGKETRPESDGDAGAPRQLGPSTATTGKAMSGHTAPSMHHAMKHLRKHHEAKHHMVRQHRVK
jgi:hypothetical protein